MAGGPIPLKDSEFNSYLLIVVPYLNDPANLPRLGISAVNIGDLNMAYGIWQVKYPQSVNTATSTTSIIGEKNEARDEIEETLRDIYDDIPGSALTQTDRDTLRLPKRDASPSRRGAIEDIPIADAKAVGGGAAKMVVRVTEDATRASKHPLADGIEMKYVLIDPAAAPPASGGGGTSPGTPTPGTPAAKPGQPASADDCSLNHFSKKAIFTVPFGASAAGKTLYCFFRWVNLSNAAHSSGWTTVKVVHLS